MKTYIFRILLPLLTLLVTAGATLPAGAFEFATRKIAVSNKGDLKFFDISDLQGAIDAAEPNDTVFVPEGNFPIITISKGIVLLGSGQNSRICGSILLAPIDTTLNAVIDGFNIDDYVYSTKPTRGVWIRMCKMKMLFYNNDNLVEDILIERCNIESLNQLGSDIAKNITVWNSYVYGLVGRGGNDSYAFINCYIGDIHPTLYARGNFINSLIKNDDRYDSDFAFFQNCLLYQVGGSHDFRENCWITNDYDVWNQIFTKKFLLDKGYIGTDGTIIGPYGGKFPYTLNPSLPTVSERKITIDYDNQLLNIDLKLTGTPEGTSEQQQAPEKL